MESGTSSKRSFRSPLSDCRGPMRRRNPARQPARPSSHGLQDGDRATIDRDRDFLPGFDSIEERPGVVAQLSGRDVGHATFVAPIRRRVSSADDRLWRASGRRGLFRTAHKDHSDLEPPPASLRAPSRRRMVVQARVAAIPDHSTCCRAASGQMTGARRRPASRLAARRSSSQVATTKLPSCRATAVARCTAS